jgi:plastocyanin
MLLRKVWGPFLGVTLAATVAACGGGSQEPATTAAPAAAPGAQRVDAATAGNVMGMAVLDGTAPKNEPIRMNADPVCVKEAKGDQFQSTFVVGDDGKSLGNVFVYVKDGLGNYVYDPPSGTATLDQKGCRYIPHVFAVRVGQPIEILNSDPTLHNIHATPKANKEFNTGQPIQGMKMTHTFTAKEVMVPFKCDVHGWMNAYVAVMDHPYYAVTGPDGKFELKGLPPGTYTVEAWHERLGTTTQSVTLGASETKEVSFTFKAAGAPAATD